MTDHEKKEKLIQAIMEMCNKNNEPVTREEAEEMAEMEIKANAITSYTQKEVEKKPRKPREVKKDPIKISFIENLAEWLTNTSVSDIIILNEQREISFNIGTDNYSLVLTKHKTKKEV